jgi:glycerol kinase
MIDHNLKVRDIEQREHRQISLHPGWCEHDPLEIYRNAVECLETICSRNGLTIDRVKALGITNQRETVVAIDRVTGEPLHNAIVWLDKRTSVIVKDFQEKLGGDLGAYRTICGLPINTYFSGVKMRWLLDHVPEVQKANEAGRLLFGTIDTWLVYVSLILLTIYLNLHITEIDSREIHLHRF